MHFLLFVVLSLVFLKVGVYGFLVSPTFGKPAADSFREGLEYTADKFADSVFIASEGAKVVSSDLVNVSENLQKGLESVSDDVKTAAYEFNDALQNVNVSVNLGEGTVSVVDAVTYRIVMIVGLICGTFLLATIIVCWGIYFSINRRTSLLRESSKVKKERMEMKLMRDDITKCSLNMSCRTSDMGFQSHSPTSSSSGEIKLQNVDSGEGSIAFQEKRPFF